MVQRIKLFSPQLHIYKLVHSASYANVYHHLPKELKLIHQDDIKLTMSFVVTDDSYLCDVAIHTNQRESLSMWSNDSHQPERIAIYVV